MTPSERLNAFTIFFERQFAEFSSEYYKGGGYNSVYRVPNELAMDIDKEATWVAENGGSSKSKKEKRKEQKRRQTLTDAEKEQEDLEKQQEEKDALEMKQKRTCQRILQLYEEYCASTYGRQLKGVNANCDYEGASYHLQIQFPAMKSGRMQPELLKCLRLVHVASQKKKLRSVLDGGLENIFKRGLFNVLIPYEELQIIELPEVSSLSWFEVEQEIRNWFEKHHELPPNVLKVYMKKEKNAVVFSLCEKWKRAFCEEEGDATKGFM